MATTRRQGRQDTIIVDSDEKSVAVRVKITASIKPAEEGGYISLCDSFDICSQGETIQEAKENIIEAAELFIESCVARHTLNNSLLRLGFTKKLNRAQRRAKQKRPVQVKGERIIEFPVELPLAA